MDSLPVRLCISVVLVAISGFINASDTAVCEANEARVNKLAEDGDKANKRAKWLIDRKQRVRNATHLYNVAFVAIISLMAYTMYQTIMQKVLATIAANSIWLIFGCYFPGKFARIKADDAVIRLAKFMRFFSCVSYPVRAVLSLISDVVLKLCRINPSDEVDEVTEEEILMMVDIGSSSGAIDPEEKEMINNIFEFDDTPAKDIMTHRTDVEFLWEEESKEEWDKVMSETNHSVYPVCGDGVDNIIGIINSRDFYREWNKNSDFDVHKLLKQAYFVPESIKADELLRNMQNDKIHFALVLDEYGGLGGIITISDLLEEIVGTLANDNDETDKDDIVQIDENTWRIDGGCDIDLVSETLGVELPVDEYNTMAGLVLSELGTIPDDGATPTVEAYGLNIKVTKVNDHRIEEVKVSKLQ